MSNQGSNLGWPPAAGGGGGGGDYPFTAGNAKNRRFEISAAKVIPAGAYVVDIYNSGINNATIQITGGNAEILRPNMRYNFEAQQDTVNLKQDLSREITITPANGETCQIFVMYPSASPTDPNTI